MSHTSPTNLAEKAFWEEDYYAGVELPARPDQGFPYERCLARDLERVAPVAAGDTVVEVGCSPARWLVWYAERFGARPTGLEYSAAGADMSRRNMALAGVEGEVREGDFFSDEVGSGAFDLVLSLGFIEHFDDIPRAFARHVDFMRPGGRLALGMPNFRGLIGALQRWGDPGFLARHNREAMRPELYTELARRHGLERETTTYLDGIDPAMVRVTRHGPGAVMLPLSLWRRLRVSDHMNGRLISAYLLMTFRLPEPRSLPRT
jgi:SAM-dependent methyltransferase